MSSCGLLAGGVSRRTNVGSPHTHLQAPKVLSACGTTCFGAAGPGNHIPPNFQRIRLAPSIVSAAVCRLNRSLQDLRSPRGMKMAAGTVDSKATVTTLATITTAATFATSLFSSSWSSWVVAIVPEARQPSVLVHSEQAPRYPFSGRKGTRMGPLDKPPNSQPPKQSPSRESALLWELGVGGWELIRATAPQSSPSAGCHQGSRDRDSRMSRLPRGCRSHGSALPRRGQPG